MENVFIHLLNMSITATWIALAVTALRLILKKAPKWIMGVLWGFLALRLICPFSFESVFSLIPSTETVPQEILTANTPAINSGLKLINQAINSVLSNSLSPNAAESINPMQTIAFVASLIWIVGMAIMLAYTLISYLRIRRKVREAVRTDTGYRICDRISTPFILGIFRPKIYLPSAMDEADRSYVLAHERAHLKRKDYLWKPLGFLLLTIYWFNPILWIAYILLCRDIELACDEKVVSEMGTEIKKPYSEALINCSVPRRTISACPLAFGEVGVKGRIKNVLKYKKPAFWISIVAVVACIVTAVCLLTNPQSNKLINIEHLDLSYTLNDTVAVMISNDGESYHGTKFDDAILDRIGNIRISSEEISLNRGENREKTNVIVLQNQSDSKSAIDSYLSGTYICFSRNFTEVWVNNGVKPTLTYKVLDSQSAKKVFMDISSQADDSSVSTVGGVDGPVDVVTQSTSTFDATVLEINGTSILVQPAEGSNELKSADKISFSLDKLDSGDLPEIKVGDKVRITYDGTIAESYPAQLSAVYAVYGINESGEIVYIYGFPSESSRAYTYNSSVEPVVKPNIVLSNIGNRFQFTYSVLSSYLAVGTYELTDDKLTLKTDDLINTYVFNVKGNTFVFDASSSSKIPKYAYSDGAKAECPVPDGAIFE